MAFPTPTARNEGPAASTMTLTGWLITVKPPIRTLSPSWTKPRVLMFVRLVPLFCDRSYTSRIPTPVPPPTPCTIAV